MAPLSAVDPSVFGIKNAQQQNNLQITFVLTHHNMGTQQTESLAFEF